MVSSLKSVSMLFGRKPTSSQVLSELAQRVDFSAVENDERSEEGPSVKKSTERWPWEDTHSKLKYEWALFGNRQLGFVHFYLNAKTKRSFTITIIILLP